MTTIILTEHAIDRYQERVRPTLSYEQAGDELEKLVVHAERVDELTWEFVSDGNEADGFLIISDGVALLMIKNRALTCLVRGEVAAPHRKHRNDKKRQARRNRRSQREADHHGRISRQKRNQRRRDQARRERDARDR